MYIAIKWLVCMSITMWCIMCYLDMYLQRSWRDQKGKHIHIFTAFIPSGVDRATTVSTFCQFSILNRTGGKSRLVTYFTGCNNVLKLGYSYENISTARKPKVMNGMRHRFIRKGQPGVSMMQYFILMSGALGWFMFKKREEVMFYTKSLIKEIDLQRQINCALGKINEINFSEFYAELVNNVRKYVLITLKYITCINNKCAEAFMSTTVNVIEEHEIESDILIKKLKEVNEDRKNLNNQVMTINEENKAIRLKLQLEKMAKERLLKHVDDINKQIKENRTKYFNFQHLYLVTHQENLFLKARVKKLAKEKNEAEQNFMTLLQKVYESKNTELRSYCSRFIVRTKKNLLNSDVALEIDNFLRKSHHPLLTTTEWNTNELCQNTRRNYVVTELNSNEIFDNACQTNGVEPKLKGLPGEGNENGTEMVINRLYSYEADMDNKNITFTANSMNGDGNSLVDYTVYKKPKVTKKIKNDLELCLQATQSSQRFLTGSKAFQNFMKDSANIYATSNPQVAPVQG